jgi:flavin reductase (DIM6/NTAB) family NADH-FMN oxidoreductase RutF
LGEVVGVHIHQNLINNGVFDTIAAAPIMRGGGPGDYFSVSEAQKFQMFRPK